MIIGRTCVRTALAGGMGRLGTGYCSFAECSVKFEIGVTSHVQVRASRKTCLLEFAQASYRVQLLRKCYSQGGLQKKSATRKSTIK